MTIYLASDHGGFKTKELIKQHLQGQSHKVIDCGNDHFDINDDYPDFISKAATMVASDPQSRGIVIGGSGQGEAMVANRVQGVRCMVFYGPVQAREAVDAKGQESVDPFEILKLSRQHNDANMLSLGGRFLNDTEVCEAVDVWLNTPFSGEQRHIRRIGKFNN